MNKKTRIVTMFVLCTVFFFLEIVVGYTSGSVALLADAFHMLSDMLSLVVALYAVKVSVFVVSMCEFVA
jgi:zinc transporter 1